MESSFFIFLHDKVICLTEPGSKQASDTNTGSILETVTTFYYYWLLFLTGITLIPIFFLPKGMSNIYLFFYYNDFLIIMIMVIANECFIIHLGYLNHRNSLNS